jgi:hypothetical protein
MVAIMLPAAGLGVWPDGATWLGAAIIIGAGIFIAVVECRRPAGMQRA